MDHKTVKLVARRKPRWAVPETAGRYDPTPDPPDQTVVSLKTGTARTGLATGLIEVGKHATTASFVC
jgi:hypothetical protein